VKHFIHEQCVVKGKTRKELLREISASPRVFMNTHGWTIGHSIYTRRKFQDNTIQKMTSILKTLRGILLEKESFKKCLMPKHRRKPALKVMKTKLKSTDVKQKPKATPTGAKNNNKLPAAPPKVVQELGQSAFQVVSQSVLNSKLTRVTFKSFQSIKLQQPTPSQQRKKISLEICLDFA
jgi:hypothetical protein